LNLHCLKLSSTNPCKMSLLPCNLGNLVLLGHLGLNHLLSCCCSEHMSTCHLCSPSWGRLWFGLFSIFFFSISSNMHHWFCVCHGHVLEDLAANILPHVIFDGTSCPEQLITSGASEFVLCAPLLPTPALLGTYLVFHVALKRGLRRELLETVRTRQAFVRHKVGVLHVLHHTLAPNNPVASRFNRRFLHRDRECRRA